MKRKIGIFGGTFDPIHVGHLIVASQMQYALDLAEVRFVPAGQPPHKPERIITADRDRLAMLELALADNPSFVIDTTDIDRAGLSYTADLLALLGERLAPDQLVFLMGEDSLRDLPTWHRPGRIAELAELAVAERPGIAADFERVAHLVPEIVGRTRLIPVPLIDISSSDIQFRVGAGMPYRYLVPAAVASYIETHGLYRTGS